TSKAVFPSQSDAPFLPTGRTVELLLKSQDRQLGSSLNDAYFLLDPVIPGVQSVSFGFFSFYNMFPNIIANGNYRNILGITGPAGVPATSNFVKGIITNTQVRSDS